MFTGLIETTGAIREARQMDRAVRLCIEPAIAYDVQAGDSVSVDGVCLTAESVAGGLIRCTAVAETLSRTTLARAQPGRRVNLERALRPDSRLGGHFVLGHVDGVGRVVEERRTGAAVERRIWAPEPLRRFLAEKGSVAVDGVSLTIARTHADGFTVALVPHTLASTQAHAVRPGAEVNIECDVLMRYIFHLIKYGCLAQSAQSCASGGVTLFDKMEQLGF